MIFNWLDVTILAILLFSGVLSLLRGFIREGLSLLCWIISIYVATRYYGLVQPYLAKYVSNDTIQQFAAMGVLFLASLILLSILSNLLNSLLVHNMISGVDRFLGFCFGLLRGAVIVVALLFVIEHVFPIVTEDNAWKTSVLKPYFIVFTHYFSELLTLASEKVDMQQIIH